MGKPSQDIIAKQVAGRAAANQRKAAERANAIPLTDKLLLTAHEVHLLTGLHEDVVYRMGKGKPAIFATVRIGRTVRFVTRSILDWIDHNMSEVA